MRPLLAALILCFSQTASAEIKSVGTINLNDGIGLTRPTGLAYDSVRNEVWVRGYNTNNLVVINAASRETVASLEGFYNIMDVVTDPPRDRVYVIESSYKISVLKASTKEKIQSFNLSPHQVKKLAVGPNGRVFLVLYNYDSTLKKWRQKIVRFNPQTGSIEASFLTPALPAGVSVNWRKFLAAGESRVFSPRSIYSSNKWNSELFILDAETLSLVEKVPLGLNVNVSALAIDPRPRSYGYGEVFVGNSMGPLIRVTPRKSDPAYVAKYSHISRSRALAVDTANEHLFSIDSWFSTVQKIDLQTFHAQSSTVTKANLQGIIVAPDLKTVFVANSTPYDVRAFHTETDAYLGATELRRDTPVDVAIPAGSNELLVTGGKSGGVMTLDKATGVEKHFFQDSYGEPSQAALFPKINRAYYLNSRNAWGGSLRVLDTEKRKIVYTKNYLYSITGMDAHPENGTLYLSQTTTPGDSQTSRLVVLDAALDVLTQTIPLGARSLYPRGLAADPASQKAYVALYGADKVASVDLANGEVLAQIPVGKYPQAVAVDPVWNRVYVANYGSDSVSVLNGKTDQVIATIPVGKGPRDIAVKRKGIRVYVLNSADGTMTVIDGRTLEVVATLPLAGLPQKIRVDQAAERIYVTNFSSASLTVFEDVAPSDSAAPVITHQPITGIQQETQDVLIQANVTDDAAVAVVSLTYWDPATGTTKTAVMEKVSGDLYQTDIPKDFMAMLGGNKVHYFIDATDFDGNGPATGSTPGSAASPNEFTVLRQLDKKWNYSFKKIYGGLYRMIPGPSPAIGEIRADHSGLEIATGNEEYWPLGSGYGNPSGRWFVFGSNGTVVFWKNTQNDEAHSSVNLFDLTGDGKLEMLGGTTSGNQLQAFDSQGNWVWRYILGSHHVSTPAVLPLGPDKKPVVFGGSFDNFFRSIDGATGKLRWAFPTNTRIWSSAAVDDLDGDGKPEVVFADEGISSLDKGTLYCLDADTGTVKWTFKISHMMRGSAALADIDNDGIKEVLIGTGDGYFYSLSGETGAVEWSFKVGSEVQSSPAVGDLDGDGVPEVVFGSSDGTLYALNADGTVFWKRNVGSPIFSSPALAKRGPEKHLSVYIGTMGGKLLIIDGRDGSLITGFSVGAEIVSSPSVADVDGDGKLEVFFQDRFGDLNDSFGDRFWALKDNGSDVKPYAREWPMFRRDPTHTGVYPWDPNTEPPPSDETAPIAKITSPADQAVLTALTAAISGTAADEEGGSGLAKVDVNFKDGASGKWWNGSAWSLTQTWLLATGTSDWTWSTPPLTDQHAYTVSSRATDKDGNVQNPPHSVSFSVKLEEPLLPPTGMRTGWSWTSGDYLDRQVSWKVVDDDRVASYRVYVKYPGTSDYVMEMEVSTTTLDAKWTKIEGEGAYKVISLPLDKSGYTYTLRRKGVDHPVGEFLYFVRCADNNGVEGESSKIVRNTHAGPLDILSVTGNPPLVKWEGPLDGEEGYKYLQVYKQPHSHAAGSATTMSPSNATSATLNVDGLQLGVTYYLQIYNQSLYNYNKSKKASMNRKKWPFMLQVAFPAPVLAIEAPPVGGELKLSWNPVDDAAGYKLYRDGEFLIQVSTTVLLDQGLTDGTTYTYKVSGVDADGHEGPKGEISGVPHDLLPPDSKVTSPAAGTEIYTSTLTVSGTAVDFGVAGVAKVELILKDLTAKTEVTLLAEGTNTFTLLLEGLEPGHSYEVGSRATDNEGNVETIVDFVAFKTIQLGTAKACIKIPFEGKKLWGNAVTVVSTTSVETVKVVTQYRYRCDNPDDGKPGHNNPNEDSDDGTQPDCSEESAEDWVTIATDEEKPWAVYWNISDAIVKTGTYDLRAVAYDAAGWPDPDPCRIWVILDDANADLVEDGNPDVDPNNEHKLVAKVSATETQEIITGDGTSVIIPAGTVEEGETIEIVTVPASKIKNLETKFVKLNPAGVFKKFTFTSGKTQFANNLTLTLPVPDVDGDGIVDGTTILVTNLKAYYFDESTVKWVPVGDSAKIGLSGLAAGSQSSPSGVTFQVDHFTLFGLFEALEEKQANSFGEIYAFPNPARPGQDPTLHIEAGPADNVEISIYDATGQLVHSVTIPGPPSTIDDGQGPEQAFEYIWRTGGLGSGTYSFVVTAKQAGAGKIRAVGRVSLIR